MTNGRRNARAVACVMALSFALALACALSCGSSAGPGAAGSGGGGAASAGAAPTTPTGGLASGGSLGSGGVLRPGSGGSAASGGAAPASSGGSTASGGNPTNSGGVATSGSSGAGGSTATGGNSGGSATGGSGGAGPGTGGSAGTSSASSCTGTSLTPGESTQTLVVGGATRSYIRHVPPNYTGKTPVSVVIDFHPLGGTASSWKGSTGWSALADKQGFIMIWPNGVENSWNAGRCCRAAMEQKIDDVGFAKAIVASLKKDGCIDAKRVYATGCSNGGGMAYRMACDAADVIAAVAPVDFDCVTNSADKPSCGLCTPARPISEIQFRGTADSAVPYEGGMHSGGTTEHPGALENFEEWGQINVCTGSPQAVPNHSACQAYPMCRADVQTALCTVQNGMHCGNYQSFKIVDIAWETFQQHPLP